jgi:hypothetical protein
MKYYYRILTVRVKTYTTAFTLHESSKNGYNRAFKLQARHQTAKERYYTSKNRVSALLGWTSLQLRRFARTYKAASYISEFFCNLAGLSLCVSTWQNNRFSHVASTSQSMCEITLFKIFHHLVENHEPLS